MLNYKKFSSAMETRGFFLLLFRFSLFLQPRILPPEYGSHSNLICFTIISFLPGYVSFVLFFLFTHEILPVVLTIELFFSLNMRAFSHIYHNSNEICFFDFFVFLNEK